ncbi:hypothetical protein, partial [Rhodopirellula baltica]
WLSGHQLASWIVARLSFLTASSLLLEGDTFAHDTNEFGYKIKILTADGSIASMGTLMIHQDRTYYKANNVAIGDSQSLLVDLLTEFPDDLDRCEIRVRFPETRRFRSYGWDGMTLLS